MERNKYLYSSLTCRWSKDTFAVLRIEYVREDRPADDGFAIPLLNVALLPPIKVIYRPGCVAHSQGEFRVDSSEQLPVSSDAHSLRAGLT
ncbi:MAG: hypothetical protein HZA32_18055 [Opitutae bacterium]|nr:hypothetical protein [Opitutae bacterium]